MASTKHVERTKVHAIGVSSKLRPELHANVMLRPRLFKVLEDALHCKGVVATAAAGYGKTSLLASFLEFQRIPFFWYRLDFEDSDLSKFLPFLMKGLYRHFAPNVTDVPSSPYSFSKNWNFEVMTALEELSTSIKGPVVLAFDNYEKIKDSTEIDTCLDYLLKYLPDNFHLFLSSRVEPRIPELARLVEYGNFLRLSEKELGFVSSEIDTLLQKSHGVRLLPEQLAELVQRTNGWAVVLPLIGKQLSGKDSSAAASLISSIDMADPTLYDYFTDYVLSAEPSRIRQFLYRSSILQELGPNVCASVTGVAESGEILGYLSQRHLFVSPIAGEHPHYFCHSLFRSFLQRRLRETEGDEAVLEFHRRAAHFALQIGEHEKAVRHFVQGQAWVDAAETIRNEAQKLIDQGYLDTVQRWIDSLPEDIVDGDPWLLLFKGRVLRRQDRARDGREIQERALYLFRQASDKMGEINALFELGWIQFYFRKYKDGIAQLRLAEKLLGDQDPVLKVGIWSGLVVNYVGFGLCAEAIRVGERALPVLHTIDGQGWRISNRVRLIRFLSWAYLYTGDVNKGITFAREAYELGLSQGSDEPTIGRNLYMLALNYRAKGELVSALEALQAAESIADKHQMPRLKKNSLSTKGDVLTTLQRFDEAENLYDLADWPTSEFGDFGILRLIQGRVQEAREVFRTQLREAEERNCPFATGRAKALLGISATQLGEEGEAETFLNEALKTFESLESGYAVAGTQLHLANLHYRFNNKDRGRRYLKQAFGFAVGNQMHNFFLCHPEVIAAMGAQALKEGIEPEFAELLCTERLTWNQRAPFLSLLNQPDCSVKAKAQRILESLSPPSNGASKGREELKACSSSEIRERLLAALTKESITLAGLSRLRNEFGLTWREVDIFTRYYVPSTDGAELERTDRRNQIAQELYLSEHTLRSHISRIRDKLGLSGRKGSLSVFQWGLQQGIISSN